MERSPSETHVHQEFQAYGADDGVVGVRVIETLRIIPRSTPRNMGKLIKADVNDLPAEALAGKAAYIIAAMDGNLNFPDPVPSIATVTAAHAMLVQAIEEAKSFARSAIAAKNLAAEELRGMLSRLAGHVNCAARGNLEIALSSGFLQRKQREAVVLYSPELLVARTGERNGSIDLNWRRVPGVKMYKVYRTQGEVNDESIWECVLTTTRTRCAIMGSERSAYYSFRITALGAAGEGPASNVSCAKAA